MLRVTPFVLAMLTFACSGSDEPPKNVPPAAVDSGTPAPASSTPGPETSPIPTIPSTECPPLGDPLPFKLEFAPPNVEVAAGSDASVEMTIVRRADFRTLVSVDAQNAPGVRLSFNAADGHTSGLAGLDSGASFKVAVEAGESPRVVEIPFSSTTACARFDQAGTLRVTIK